MFEDLLAFLLHWAITALALALVLLLVSFINKGFKVSGFWAAFFASVFISVLSIVSARWSAAVPKPRWRCRAATASGYDCLRCGK